MGTKEHPLSTGKNRKNTFQNGYWKMQIFEVSRESGIGKIENLLEIIGGNKVSFSLNLTYSIKMST